LIELWNKALLEPILNGLVWLSHIFGGEYGVAIIFMTLIINIILLPLTYKSTKSMMAMQAKQRAIQPKMQELQKKYAKDKQRLQQEMFKLYKEHGISPMGCMSPFLLLFIQMPFWIAIYQSVTNALAITPERLLGLTTHLYDSPVIQKGIPPDHIFLGINLAQPNFILVLLVMLTMWITQRMTATPSPDPKQQQTQQMMQYLFPLMFGIIFIGFPSGLPLYIVVSNLFRMVVQRSIMGTWGDIRIAFWRKAPAAASAGASASSAPNQSSAKKPPKALSPSAPDSAPEKNQKATGRSRKWKLWK